MRGFPMTMADLQVLGWLAAGFQASLVFIATVRAGASGDRSFVLTGRFIAFSTLFTVTVLIVPEGVETLRTASIFHGSILLAHVLAGGAYLALVMERFNCPADGRIRRAACVAFVSVNALVSLFCSFLYGGVIAWPLLAGSITLFIVTIFARARGEKVSHSAVYIVSSLPFISTAVLMAALGDIGSRFVFPEQLALSAMALYWVVEIRLAGPLRKKGISIFRPGPADSEPGHGITHGANHTDKRILTLYERINEGIMVTDIGGVISERRRHEDIWKCYEAIVNASYDFMALINREYRYEAVNDSFCISLNKKRDEIVGRHVSELWTDSVYANEIKPYLDMCFSGIAVYHQNLVDFRTLGERYLDSGYYPYHKGDDITHVIVLSRDITEMVNTEKQLHKAKEDLEHRVEERTRKLIEMNRILESEIAIREQVETDLRDSEEKYRLLVETMTDGLIMVNGDNFITYVNGRMAEMLGYNPDEMVGSHLLEFLDKKNRAIMRAQLAKRKKGIRLPYEIDWTRKNGRKLPTSVSPQIIYDSDGAFAGSFGVIRDITDRKDLERRIRKAKTIAESASRAKSLFLANISHEIRTPMNAILGFSELLESQIDNEDHRECLSAVISSGRTLMSLINDILDMSKIEAGKFEFDKSPLDMRIVMKEVDSIFAAKYREKKIGFSWNVDPSVPEYLSLDGIRMRQILFNLVGNAIKFTDEGSVTVDMRCAGNGERVDLSLSVSDTGIGIPDDQQALIFEAFRQREGQRQSHYGGTGLGLAITRRLVEAMGGSIGVKSVSGRGSVFTITLNGVTPCGNPVEKPSVDETAPDDFSFDGLTALVVDDVESNRALLKGYLRGRGMTIVEAESGEQALYLADEHLPDIVLLDVVMPGMSGGETLQKMKENRRLASIPVIAITATPLSERDDDPGVLYDCYLVKPVGRRDLLREMARCMQRRVAHKSAGGRDIPSYFVEHDGGNSFTDADLKLERELKEKIWKDWERIRERIVFDEIRHFSTKIKGIGEHYGFHPLILWAESLSAHAGRFNIEAVLAVLNHFPDIVNRVSRVHKSEGPDIEENGNVAGT